MQAEYWIDKTVGTPFTPIVGVQSSAVPGKRELPRVLFATFAVVGLPILAVSLLRASGAVASPLALIATGTVLSLAASYAGAALWAASTRAGDTVFGDLMLWGWLRRRRTERQLASTIALLGLQGGSKRHRPRELAVRRREQLLRQLAAGLEARDPDTHGHSRRVARHAAAIAKRMGLSREQIATIRTAAAVHDVGKIETPESVLKNPGSLTEAEWEVIREHTTTGERLVCGLEDEELAKIVRHHHERMDGSGYPDGVVGDQIPIGARIVAVADTFDAVTSSRPYRSARSHREALNLLGAAAGTQLDPEAVRAFRNYYSGLRSVALWSFGLNGPRQLFASLPDQIRLGDVVIATKMTTATVATVAAGVAVQSATTEPAPAGRSLPTAAQVRQVADSRAEATRVASVAADSLRSRGSGMDSHTIARAEAAAVPMSSASLPDGRPDAAEAGTGEEPSSAQDAGYELVSYEATRSAGEAREQGSADREDGSQESSPAKKAKSAAAEKHGRPAAPEKEKAKPAAMSKADPPAQSATPPAAAPANASAGNASAATDGAPAGGPPVETLPPSARARPSTEHGK